MRKNFYKPLSQKTEHRILTISRKEMRRRKVDFAKVEELKEKLMDLLRERKAIHITWEFLRSLGFTLQNFPYEEELKQAIVELYREKLIIVMQGHDGIRIGCLSRRVENVAHIFLRK